MLWVFLVVKLTIIISKPSHSKSTNAGLSSSQIIIRKKENYAIGLLFRV